MGKTWFEEEAARLLAERGAKSTPRELHRDLADWLELFYHRGQRQTKVLLLRVLRDAEIDIKRLREQAEAASEE